MLRNRGLDFESVQPFFGGVREVEELRIDSEICGCCKSLGVVPVMSAVFSFLLKLKLSNRKRFGGCLKCLLRLILV